MSSSKKLSILTPLQANQKFERLSLASQARRSRCNHETGKELELVEDDID